MKSGDLSAVAKAITEGAAVMIDKSRYEYPQPPKLQPKPQPASVSKPRLPQQPMDPVRERLQARFNLYKQQQSGK
jgi:hypothetical protein